MLFCMSVCDETGRVILDDEPHGEVIAVVEGKTWAEAYEAAYIHPALDAYTYRKGDGWVRRDLKSRNIHLSRVSVTGGSEFHCC